MPFEKVLSQPEGSKDEIHMFLICIVECIERVVASGLCGVRRIEDAEVLQTPGGLDVRQEAIQEFAFTLAVEDDHRHLPVSKSTHQILSDDVFKECGLARASTANNDTVLHPDDIGPQPRLFVDIVSEQCRRSPAGPTSDIGIR